MKKKRQSFAHVPDPDPANFWTFTVGQEREVGTALRFRVNSILDAYVIGTMVLDGKTIPGMLYLNRSVVMSRFALTGEPEVTFTLRRVEAGVAYLQVTHDPGMKVIERQ